MQTHRDLSASFNGFIGRTATTDDIVTRQGLARFRATLGKCLAPVEEDIVPLDFHWCLATDTVVADASGRDGHAAKGTFLPPINFFIRNWAGGEIEAVAPIRVGERVKRHSVIGDIEMKIAPIMRAFAPNAKSRNWAERVVAAGADGPPKVDGGMVDRPVVERALRILELAARTDASNHAETGGSRANNRPE